MENFIKFLQETKLNVISNQLGDFHFFKFGEDVFIKCALECKPNHLQPLKDLGVKFDFSNKKVDFAHNQNTVGATGNTLRVNCSMNLDTFILLSNFLRGEFRANLHNDQQLIWRGFKLKENKKYIEIPNQINFAIEDLKKQIRRNIHAKKYNKQTLNLVLIKKVLNKY